MLLPPLVSTAAAAVALCLLGCTTYVSKTSCAEDSTGCDGIRDARFCEDVVERTAGADCAASHLVADKPFCVVSETRCTGASYALRTGDCRILEYREVRDDARDECAPNVPMFVYR